MTLMVLSTQIQIINIIIRTASRIVLSTYYYY